MHSILESIDQVHSAAGACANKGIVTHRVVNTQFQRFSSAVTNFELHLKETDTEENWRSQLGYLKLFRIKFATSIIAAPELCKMTRLRGSALSIQALLTNADPATVTLFHEVDNTFKALQTEHVNPLFKSFVDSLAAREIAFDHDAPISKKRIALLCEWNDLFGAMNLLVRELNQFRLLGGCKGGSLFVIKPSQLKEGGVFDEVVAFGSWRWLERKGHSFVFRAPRCRSIVNYTFSIFPDYRPQFYQLVGSPHEFSSASNSRPTLSHKGFSAALVEEDLAINTEEREEVSKILDEMLPSLDIDRLSRRTVASDSEEQAEHIEAKFVELSGYNGVWLSHDGKVYRMELSHSSRNITCDRVRHVEVSEIEPGDVLIFSTAGGGDMIAEEANLLMGKRAGAMRAAQHLWKQKLAELAKGVGAEWLCQILKGLDVGSISIANLRNWINPTNIAPGNRDHFIAILEKCGLESEIERILDATDRIRRAHRAAGFRLSKKLLRMIQGNSLADLISVGFQVFGGNDVIASEKTCFTVESINSGKKMIDSGAINKPFTLDEDLWH